MTTKNKQTYLIRNSFRDLDPTKGDPKRKEELVRQYKIEFETATPERQKEILGEVTVMYAFLPETLINCAPFTSMNLSQNDAEEVAEAGLSSIFMCFKTFDVNYKNTFRTYLQPNLRFRMIDEAEKFNTTLSAKAKYKSKLKAYTHIYDENKDRMSREEIIKMIAENYGVTTSHVKNVLFSRTYMYTQNIEALSCEDDEDLAIEIKDPDADILSTICSRENLKIANDIITKHCKNALQCEIVTSIFDPFDIGNKRTQVAEAKAIGRTRAFVRKNIDEVKQSILDDEEDAKKLYEALKYRV